MPKGRTVPNGHNNAEVVNRRRMLLLEKKGHLWFTFTDGGASIDGVAWSSTIRSLTFLPKQDDGVVIIGKLN